MRQIQMLAKTMCERNTQHPRRKQNMVHSAVLLTWQDGPLGRSGWGRNRGMDEGLLVHSAKAVNTNGERGWRSKWNTKHLVLTAPELGGVVKVGEERVKLVRTEERVTADLRAAGNSYVRDNGSLEGEGCKLSDRVGSFRVGSESRG